MNQFANVARAGVHVTVDNAFSSDNMCGETRIPRLRYLAICAGN